MVEECTCDMLALKELFSFQIPGKPRLDSLKEGITLNHLCLLTKDFIRTTSRIRKYQNRDAYQYIDEVYMRKVLEKEAVHMLIMSYSVSSNDFADTDRSQLVAFSDEVSEMTDTMYCEFSEHMGNLDLSEDVNEYIPFGSEEWMAYYFQVSLCYTVSDIVSANVQMYVKRNTMKCNNNLLAKRSRGK